MPLAKNLIEAAGNATQANYIEDCFSSYLYTGNGSTQNIVNGIDLSTKGGMVWLKGRTGTQFNNLEDTNRGAGYSVYSNSTIAQEYFSGYGITSFNTNGFTLGLDNYSNANTVPFVSWTFRKQPKFFDVVTYTGNGTAGHTISHNLGSVPGCIIIKNLTTAGTTWCVYHKDISGYIQLQSTSAASSTTVVSNVTSTSFDVAQYQFVNGNTESLVAYIFAHDAGGFGLTGTDNVISCGGGTFDSNGYANVNLGYEPQWVLIKPTSYADNWYVSDNMRGMSVGSSGSVPYTAPNQFLYPNTSGAEAASNYGVMPNSTGFKWLNGSSGGSFIYIAIRRGPMKVPTDGTKVFSTNAQTTAAPTTVTTNFPVDMEWWKNGRSALRNNFSFDRLRGGTQQLRLNTTDAEQTDVAPYINYFDSNTAFRENWSSAGQNAIFWSFRRAPSFFDEVCYRGTGATQAITHNLGVTPQMIILKGRSQNFNTIGANWGTWVSSLGTSQVWLNADYAYNSPGTYMNMSATSTTFTDSYNNNWNLSGQTYVAYLFATCAGVSKVGSYTGTGTTKQIDCGFAAGARFVLIKRTDSTGDWYVWDTARGIVSGNDPYLLLNSTAAEVTSTDYIDTYSAGFELSSTAPVALNASGGTYIFLAIA